MFPKQQFIEGVESGNSVATQCREDFSSIGTVIARRTPTVSSRITKNINESQNASIAPVSLILAKRLPIDESAIVVTFVSVAADAVVRK